jgi:hypothetical protein
MPVPQAFFPALHKLLRWFLIFSQLPCHLFYSFFTLHFTQR